MHNIVVVGGNGFIGSAICKAALGRGMKVTSISSSGRPYRTPKGHSPAWTEQVTWHAGNALEPHTYAHLMSNATAVVHTIGTLLEDTQYKKALQQGDVSGFLGGLVGIKRGNPLDEDRTKCSYETLNRDTALRVCETFLASEHVAPAAEEKEGYKRPFVYISAEDINRPLISGRYIGTKREAERKIQALVDQQRSGSRAVFIRPSLVYHAHFRPMTTLPATVLDFSAVLHRKVPQYLPTPAGALRLAAKAISSPEQDREQASAFHSMANALTVPPIHVDHVAEAVCASIEDTSVQGPLGVKEMRELIGWADKSSDVQGAQQHST